MSKRTNGIATRLPTAPFPQKGDRSLFLNSPDKEDPLADLTRQLAEAKQRAEVLARANVAMAKTISRLADQPDIRHFVGHALEVFAQEFNAVGAEFWRFVSATQGYEVALSYDRTSGVISGSEKDWNEMNSRIPHRDTKREQNVLKRIIDYIRYDEIYSSPILEPFRERLRAQSIRTILSVPVFFKDQCLGAICLRLDHDRVLNPMEEEFAFALAQQMALALQMSRLAEEAKQAAIAREQEQAAQAEAAELTKANEIMRSTVEVMTSIPDLDAFIGKVMVAINESLEAPGGTLWFLDHQRKTARLAMTVLDGQWHLQPPGKPGRVLATEFPFDETTFEVFIQNRSPRFTPNLRQHPQVDPGTRHWLEDLGVIGVQELPIVVGNQVIGILDIHRPDNEPFHEMKLQLALALTQQVGLALHITRLAEEAKQAAISREQEQAATEKVAELVKANDALRRSVDSLIDLESINNFLGISLRTIADVLEVPSACFWKNQNGFSHLELVYQNGRVIPGKESNHPNAFSPNLLNHELNLDRNGELRSDPFFTLIDDPDVPFTDPQRRMLRDLGVRALLSIPIVLGETVVARITARLTHEMSDPTPSRMELIRALANQAALALQVSRLAEEAKQAAIAWEQEQAARQREAELSASNLALRQSISRLIVEPNIHYFLEQVLRDAAKQIGAQNNSLFLIDPETQTKNLLIAVDGGKIVDLAHDPVYAVWRRPVIITPRNIRNLHQSEGKEYALDFSQSDLCLPQEVLDFHRALGHQKCVVVPLLAGERVIAAMVLCFLAEQEIIKKGLDVVRSLGQQLALALELSRLGREAEQAAVLEERARIAGEIHDTLAQSFAAISLHTELAEEQMANGSAEASASILKARDLARFGLSEARRSVLTLRPSHVLQLGLVHATQQLAERTSVQGVMECVAQIKGKPRRLDAAIEHEVFRIMQEAVNNAARHAHPGRIKIVLHFLRTGVTMQVHDNGIGLALEQSRESGGFGLFTMRERAEKLGGEFVVTSRPGKGTRVAVSIPSPRPFGTKAV